MKYEFIGAEAFEAFNKAEKFAREKNLAVGSMASNMPIGLAPCTSYKHISKWYNLDAEDKKHLTGVIVGNDKRNGPVTVIIFDEVDTLENIPAYSYY